MLECSLCGKPIDIEYDEYLHIEISYWNNSKGLSNEWIRCKPCHNLNPLNIKGKVRGIPFKKIEVSNK